jgi:epoxyqueuosine reductase
MVRTDQIAGVVPLHSRRPREGGAAVAALRRTRLLTAEAAKAALVADAGREGFDLVRIAAPDSIPEAAARLEAFIAGGRHGTMDWLEETADRRGDPRKLWPEVRSVIMLGLNYGPEGDPLAALTRRDRGSISVYARNRDYHGLIKGRLKLIASRFAKRAEGRVKVFVDTAPLMEKPFAEAAGLGWQGKHTNLVSREFGSWLFLGAILTDLELPRDHAEADHCGSCTACLDACPTAAFPAPYQLDARRCISYLTIEHDGPIPHEFRNAIGNRIFGCDDCLAVCPWNRFAKSGREMKLAARNELDAPRLEELAALDDQSFRRLFAGSPVKRIGRARFLRNVLIAIGNSGAPELADAALALLRDPSPLVRGAAVWAVRRLVSAADLAEVSERCLAGEADPDVIAEWRA